MASWIPSSIQKRLLRYALNRSGLLDVTGIDLDNLDISWGRRTALEFKNVNLNVEYLSGLAQLPPSLRLESARILLLRLTIPADILSSSISVDIDGVDVVAQLVEEVDREPESRIPERTSRDAQSPSHRKTNRRIQSPPPGAHGQGKLPTTEDLAKSFLAEEPLAERRELEASVAANAKHMEESVFSESSDDSDVGTGAAPGLPGFLSGWLQRLIDRFEMKARNIHVSLGMGALTNNDYDASSTDLDAKLERFDLLPVPEGSNKREVQLGDFSIELVADNQVFSDLSYLSSPVPPASPTASRATRSSRLSEDVLNQSFSGFVPHASGTRLDEQISGSVHQSTTSTSSHQSTEQNDPPAMTGSKIDPTSNIVIEDSVDNLDIQMGDDNISWTSRRSQGDGPNDDLWSQPTEDLPESLILGINHPLPRSHVSTTSGSSSRSRRPTSPYDRSLHSPGSWPRVDEGPERNRTVKSPGSWPTLDQSHHTMFESVIPDPVEIPAGTTDNKQSALESSPQTADSAGSPPSEPSPAASVDEEDMRGLEQSRYFSHEEAESMYMSAVSVATHGHMPGGWESEITSTAEPEEPQIDQVQTDPSLEPATGQFDTEAVVRGTSMPPDTAQSMPESPPEAVTPRASSPSPPTPSQPEHVPQTADRVKLQLLYVDIITVVIPRFGNEPSNVNETPTPPADTFASASKSVSMSRAGMPGAFSTYSQLSSSQRRGAASVLAEREVASATLPSTVQADAIATRIEVQVGLIRLQADTATSQLLYQTAKALATTPSSTETASDKSVNQQTELSVSANCLDIAFHQQITHRLDQDLSGTHPGMVNFSCHRIRMDSKPTHQTISLGMLQFGIGEHKVVSFDQDAQALAESMVFEDDLRVFIDTSKHTVQTRPITNIGVQSRPIIVEADLSVFDDVFSGFGGVSGVLDIGNSMASEVTPLASPTNPDRPQRVRFEGDTESTNTSPEYKANVSLAGLTFVLRANDTAVALRSASVKAVCREKAASVRFSGSVRLSGPYMDGTNTAPIHVDIFGLWVHYLFTPAEQDIERLLALITPSKDKYDNDDDILLGTLIRQRSKGSCLRVTVDDIKAKIDNFDCLNALQDLSTAVARLAVVTKYLPEDERPGLLSLVRIKNVEARVPVNDRFGTMQATLRDVQFAHVGLPALLAVSLSNVSLAQTGGPELIHALVPFTGSDDLPMIMARMLGGEAEPVVKIKLYNVCVEYSVPILSDLTGTDTASDPEELVTELAASIADLTTGAKDSKPSESKPAKRTQIHLLLHNSAIGLAPQKALSKGLFVLTDARFSTIVPPEDTMDSTLELRQAGILITDNAQAEQSENATQRRNSPESTVVDARVLNAFWKQGYASVGSIMSAVITIRVEQAAEGSQSSVEVDVRNDFLLLETCADSMQTLNGILGGLSPPTPPSKESKYLTEPITIDDMISSFSGDAYAKPQRTAETLFDVDEEPDPSASMMGDDADDLLMDADMDSSLYGPVSGMIGDLEDETDRADQDYGETVESLLEDDPFEMTDSPDDMPFSDAALLRDLRQQALPAKSAEPVDLGNYEIEDLGFDALGVDEGALGTRHRFSAPTSRRGAVNKSKTKKLPFKLKMRDVHATWHMHDGYDWQQTRDGITAAVEHVEQRAEERLARRRQARTEPEEEESTIGDCMFNSVYITVPTNFTEAPDIRRGINRQIDDLASESESIPASGMTRPTAYSSGGRPIRQTNRRRLKLERSRYHKISFELKGASVDMDVFPPGSGEMQSTVDIRLKQFEIFDNVPSSTWKKFLTQQQTAGSQEIEKPMVHIELLNRKTIQEREATDLMIHVSVQPLRLHVDQDALDFITRFTSFKDSAAEPPSPSDQPFLSRVEIETVDLLLDYKPKNIDYVGLRSGRATEFMNFVILDQANIRLRHAIVYGIRGFEPLHDTLNAVWMPDVKRNQLPTILGGLAPVRSLVNIGTGMRDVVAIPIREYKKDGRIVRSVQKGAFHFGKTTASELARLGAKVALGTQTLLSGAEGLLSNPGTSSTRATDLDPDAEDNEPRAFSAYADQPLGVLAGLKSARRYLEHDLLTAKDALIAVQGEVLESSNPGSAAMAVARHAPTVMLRPVIGASRALGTTLLGVGNQIDRGGVKRMEDKYKSR